MTRGLACPVKKGAARHPDRVAVVQSGRRYSWRQLDRLVDGMAARVVSAGARPGDVVAVIADNSVHTAALFFAAFRCGFVMMPVNNRLGAPQWRRQLELAGCRLVLCDEKAGRSARYPDVTTLAIDPSKNPGRPDRAVDLPAAGGRPDRDGLIVFTSGSRGEPAGVVLTWANIEHSARASATVLDPGVHGRWLAVLPFYHIGGISIVYRTMRAGGCVGIVPRYSAGELARRIVDDPVEIVSVVPTMLHDLLEKTPDDAPIVQRLRAMRAIVLGGAPVGKSLRDRITSLELPVYATWGMTETASMVTLLEPGQRDGRPGSSGRCLPGTELIVTDDRGHQLAPGKKGRIRVRGGCVFDRYLGAGRTAVPDGGWFDTGDIGRLDEDGFLTVCGRADRVFVSGGENIDPGRIEAALAALPGVRAARVLARADRRRGATPVAFVEPENRRPGDRPGDLDERLKRALCASLPGLMVPDQIVLVDRLPRTGSGKYDDEALRRRHARVFKAD